MTTTRARALAASWALLSLSACSGDPSATTAEPSTANSGGTAGTNAGAGTTNTGGAAGNGAADAGGAAGNGAGAQGGSPPLGQGGTAGSGGQASIVSDTLFVDGRFLHDRCGQKLMLRGVNEMIVWSAGKDGLPEFAEIAKTGANAVRIVWNGEGSAAELDLAITNAVAEKLVPIVEHHGATGDLSKLPETVDYWTGSDVVAVLAKHASYLLLNVANESGDGAVTPEAFSAAYQDAITRIRDTGLTLPIVIDAPSWGQDIDMLQATGPALIEHDPEHNLLFSVHMWWSDAAGDRVTAELAETVTLGLPLIVGEFAQHAVSGCNTAPFNYQMLLQQAQTHEIGWLAWSWGAVTNGDCADQGAFDMTTGGLFGSWKETWGSDVAVDDPNSIQNTAVRPPSLTADTCQ
jgi:mannan endo-1,4-beta-mannosidase